MQYKRLLTLSICTLIMSACAPSIEGIYSKATEHFLNKQYAEAIPLYEKILKHDPTNINAPAKLALSNFELKEYDKAIKYGHMAIEYKADFFEIYLILAQAHMAQKDQKETLKAYAQGMKKFPDRLSFISDYAYVSLQWNKPEQSLEIYKKLTTKAPKNREFLLLTAQISYQLKDLETAETFYKKLLDLKQGHIEANFGIAQIYDKQKKADLALKHYKKAILNNPNHLSALYNFAKLSSKNKSKEEAISAWNAYVEKAKQTEGQEKFIMKALKEIKQLKG